MATSDWLPPLMEFNDYGGNWETYLEAVYAVFRDDFVLNKPIYQGRRLGLKRHPVIQGKEATFWHFVSTGNVEEDRLPDFRRCERIGWPKPSIEHASDPEVLLWVEPRGSTDNRIHIYLPNERYLVVLADRGKYILPWTAYHIERENAHLKYLKRHERYT